MKHGMHKIKMPHEMISDGEKECMEYMGHHANPENIDAGHNTMVGKTGLRMSSGEVRHFKSKKKRANFERVAQAYKHGWRPTRKG